MWQFGSPNRVFTNTDWFCHSQVILNPIFNHIGSLILSHWETPVRVHPHLQHGEQPPCGQLGHLILSVCLTLGTISRSPSCWIDPEESWECGCQGWKLLIESEGFDVCGSNGQPLEVVWSQKVCYEYRPAIQHLCLMYHFMGWFTVPLFLQLSGNYATRQHLWKYANAHNLFAFLMCHVLSLRSSSSSSTSAILMCSRHREG